MSRISCDTMSVILHPFVVTVLKDNEDEYVRLSVCPTCALTRTDTFVRFNSTLVMVDTQYENYQAIAKPVMDRVKKKIKA